MKPYVVDDFYMLLIYITVMKIPVVHLHVYRHTVWSKKPKRSARTEAFDARRGYGSRAFENVVLEGCKAARLLGL